MDTIEIFRLFGSIFVDNDEANKSISRTEKNADSLSKRLGNGIKTAGKWALGLGAAAAGVATAAFAMTKKVTGNFDDIAKASQRLGITTDFYQEMNYWANQNGISASSMERAVGRLNQRIGMAADGNEKYSNALVRLGVDIGAVTDGTVSAEDAMVTAIQTLSEMESESEKSAAAAELFGTRMGRDLMTALQDSSMTIDEAREAAERLGIVIDEDAINAGVSFQDNLTDIQASLGGLTQSMVSYMIPAFVTITDFIIDNVLPTMHDLWGAFKEGEGFVGGLKNVFNELFDGEGITGLFDTVKDIFGNIVSWLASDGIPLILKTIIEGRVMLLETAMQLFPAILEAAVEFLPNLVSFLAEELIPNIINFILESIPMLFDAAINLFDSLIEAVQTLLPQLIDLLFNVLLPNVLETILNMIPDLLNSAIELFTSLLTAVTEILPNLLGLLLGEVLPNLLLTILDMIPQLLETAVDLFFSLIDAVMTVLPQLLTTIVTVVLPNLISTLIKLIPKLLVTAIDVFMTLLDGLIRLVPELISFIIFDLIPSVINAFKELDLLQIGKDLITGLWNGIKSMGSWIAGKISSFIADKVPGPIKKVLGIASPSKLTTEYGEDTAEGLVVGAENKESEVERASEDLAAAAAKPFEAGMHDVSMSGTTTHATPKNDFTAMEGLLMELIQAVKDGKNINIDGRKLGEINDDEQGLRIGLNGRRVAY